MTPTSTFLFPLYLPYLPPSTYPQERNRSAFLASRVSIPSRAPRIQGWHVKREGVVREACHRLEIYSGGGGGSAARGGLDGTGEPRVVGLAGPAGCGKSTAAAMVVAREDVRGHFHEGIVWLPVGGRGAVDRIPELMLRLANLVYDRVVERSGRSSAPPPRRPCAAADRHTGLAYTLGALSHLSSSGGSDGGQRRRFLIVADDVYEPEVLEELRGVGACVLFTTTRSASGMRCGGGGGGEDGDGDGDGDGDAAGGGSLLIRMDNMEDGAAETVLRRASGLEEDGAELPRPAHDLIKSYGSVVMDVAYIGRWGLVRGRTDEKAWDTALSRILAEGDREGEGEEGEERWTRRQWHTAVLLAGLADLGRANHKAKDLYLYLAVLPRGLSFSVSGARSRFFFFSPGCAVPSASLLSFFLIPSLRLFRRVGRSGRLFLTVLRDLIYRV